MFGSARTRAQIASGARRATRWAWVGGVVLALALAATALLARSTRPLYRSEAVVVYQRAAQPPGHDPGSARESLTWAQDELTSRRRLEVLIRELALYPEIVEKHGSGHAVDELRRRLSISPRDAVTLRVAYAGETRELAQQVLDRLIRGAIAEETSRRVREARDSKTWTDDERTRADNELRIAELALAAFRQAHPGRSDDGENSQPAPRSTGDELTARTAAQLEIAQLEMKKASLETSLADARRDGAGSGAASSPAIAEGRARAAEAQATINRARAELQAAQQDLAEKLTRLTDQHPDVRAARRRGAEARASVDQAVAEARALGLANLDRPAPAPANPPSDQERAILNMISAIDGQIAAIRARANRVAGSPGSPAGVETERTRLAHEVSQAQERQAQIEAKQFQAQLWLTALGAGLGGGLVVADPPARPTDPVSGRRARIWLAGSALGMLLALAVIAGLSVLDDRLYAASDLERVAGEPIVVAVSRPPAA